MPTMKSHGAAYALFLTFAVFVLSAPSTASASSGDGPEAGSKAVCGAVMGSLGYAAGGVAAKSIAQQLSGYLSFLGSYSGVSMSTRCANSVEEWARHYQDNPVDYDEFVRDQCGGNPLNCPGNLNPFPNPNSCVFIVDCAMPHMGSGPVTLGGMLEAFQFVHYSYQAGVWLNQVDGSLPDPDFERR